MKTKVKNLSKEWTLKQKMVFVNRMETLPIGVNKFDLLQRYGIPRRQYNGWVERYGVTSIYSPVFDSIKRVTPTVVKMFKDNLKIMYTMELSVIVSSMDELLELVTNIQNVPKVQNVNSVKGMEQYLTNEKR